MSLPTAGWHCRGCDVFGVGRFCWLCGSALWSVRHSLPSLFPAVVVRSWGPLPWAAPPRVEYLPQPGLRSG